jgi:hypothetical protein
MWKAFTSRLKQGGDTQLSSAVVSVTARMRGAAGGSGWRGVVRQVLMVPSCELDTIREKSSEVARLCRRGITTTLVSNDVLPEL